MHKSLYLGLLIWTILASLAAASEHRSAKEVGVFHCAFGEDWDVNYDHWPDRWVRKTGPDYPHYVNIEIADDDSEGKCLRIDVDGAAAAVTSPPIHVMSRFSYSLEVKLKNEQLDRSHVVITLDFFDAAGKLLQSEKTKPIGTTSGWQEVRLDSIQPNNPAIERAVLALEVVRGTKGDLHGRVSVGDVWLARLPRISVSTNNPFNVYTDASNVAVKCELSGIREQDPEIRFQLFDSTGAELDRGSARLNGRLISENADRGKAAATEGSNPPAGYEGSREWRPKIPGYGYYRIIVKMLSSEAAENIGDENRELEREKNVWLAVVPPLAMPSRGEFGWSLPSSDNPLTLDNLSRLLPQVGINWVKLPTWYDAGNSRRGDDLIRFVELVGASNIEVVGVIDRPPAGSEFANRLSADATVADVLSAESSTVWSPSLEPVMTRLSLRVRWWQLGRDFDTSFAADPNVTKTIGDLRTKLFRFGQDVRLGLCWDWDSEHQPKDQVAWDFQQMCFSAPAPPAKLNALLSKKHVNSALRWVLVEPPRWNDESAPAGETATAEKFREFVMQLVSAKEHGAEAIIVPNPFNDENGLMRANGMPAEFLLPWRTTAAMLGGASFMGSIQLPGGSENRIFLRPDGQVVMVVWNSKPTQEAIYLGKKIQQYDILGQATTPRMEKNEHVIEVGPQPTFVLGLHEAITRWRMALAFEKNQVPSIYSKPHANALRIQNFFPQGVGGSLSIVVPQDENQIRSANEGETPEKAEVLPDRDRWSIDPPEGVFKLARDGSTRFPFEIRLKNGATFGKQPICINFNVEADEPYQFSVYREMEVGTGDVTLEVRTYLNDEGVLIVEQLMTNLTDELADFKCRLGASRRRTQRSQVYQLGKVLDRKIYRFPKGDELIGQKMLLEIEELNGDRLFRYRFDVTNSPPEDKASPQAQPKADAGRVDLTE